MAATSPPGKVQMHSRNTDVAYADQPEKSGPSTSRRARSAAVALATTVGAAAVVTTALAPAAEATSSHHTVWDKVASCESGQRWHVHTGNGFYGGLQFSDRTWDAYRHHHYAARADEATRTEQIEVARRVLHAQGRNAWPVCGPRAGLTKHNGHATGTKLPRTAGEPSGESHSGKHASHKTAKHHSHHGKHRAHGGYRVKSGDTLSSIAHRHHVEGGWHALYKANKSHLHNPNVLKVGQHLTLP